MKSLIEIDYHRNSSFQTDLRMITIHVISGNFSFLNQVYEFPLDAKIMMEDSEKLGNPSVCGSVIGLCRFSIRVWKFAAHITPAKKSSIFIHSIGGRVCNSICLLQ